jgi:hypothetical protein
MSAGASGGFSGPTGSGLSGSSGGGGMLGGGAPSGGMLSGSSAGGLSAGSTGGMPSSAGGMLGGVGVDDIGEADLDSYVSAMRPSPRGAGWSLEWPVS